MSIWQNFDGLFLIWQNAEPSLANFWHYWANFPCYLWPLIENNLTLWSHWWSSNKVGQSFLKHGPFPASFSFIFVFSNKH